ncbi:diol dehydratase small subunit [Klebsiella pneumoniae subsp. pneumoniae]|nr:diol dehydratase small subunit [Klebsiella pneumoniae subsp. pneumoniae]
MSEKTMRVQDYPLATRCPEHPDAYRQTIDRYYPREGALWEVGPQDVRISRQTLEYQAQIAEQMQRHAVARNFRRAAELIAIPDERILAIYNALRPFRLAGGAAGDRRRAGAHLACD